ncbi:hypothetical protein AB0K35_33890 [Micromonospora sp. NPDC053740]|uniref:hypothetical protein n=1 Tax=Micromonospora sp. NPDC053740 TaxID=3155173 RepID=UPI00344A0BBE
MADSAMVSAGVVQQPADQREELRAAVIAGAAGFGVLDERVTGRLRPLLVGAELIGRAQAEAGYVDGRRRVLTGAVTAMIVLGLCLRVGSPGGVSPQLLPGALDPQEISTATTTPQGANRVGTPHHATPTLLRALGLGT